MLLFIHNIDKVKNDLCAFLKTMLTGVDAEIIVARIIPLTSRVSLVIRAALTVDLFYLLFSLFPVKTKNFHSVLYAVFLVCPDEKAESSFSVSENEVSASSDDDAGRFLLRKFLYDLCLIVEEVFFRGEIRTVRRSISPL